MEQKEERIRAIALSYYSRKDVLNAIFDYSQDREVSPRYFEGFGKRPDSFQYPSDIISLVKHGATSFHCSEELWSDPLQISTDFSLEKLNDIRKGWDLVIDIDCKWIDYSKKAAISVLQALEFRGIKNLLVKFSVSGDTPILIDHNEKIKLISISEVIELLKKKENIKVLSLDKHKKLVFSKVYNFLQHKDVLYEIYHDQSNIPVKTTKHHSVFIWDKGELVEKKVEDIKRGDYLVTFNSKDNPFVNENLVVDNTFQFLNKQIKSTVCINKDLMRLIGYFLAEGHITNTIHQVGFTFNRNEKEYIEDCKNLLSSFTGRKISLRSPNYNSVQILIHSKEWAKFFDENCGKKKDKHLPPFSWTIKKELFYEMLKGYIRGDGHKKGKYQVTVKSVSKRLITEFVWLCKLNGISCSLSYEKNKPHILPQGSYFKGSLVYIIKIPKSELFSEFYCCRNKFSPLPRDKTFPIDGLKEVYYQVQPKLFSNHRAEQMTLKKDRANLKRIEKVLDWFYKHKSKELTPSSKKIIANYKSIFNSDIGIVKINNIIKKQNKEVFDVSVEESESFFGNYYPILLHNSGSKGFHIIVPWQSFPEKLDEIKVKDMFPEYARIILLYIKELARPILEDLIKESNQDFSSLKDFTGVKCEKCNLIAQERYLINLRCDSCYPPYIEAFKSSNKEYKPKKCPNCGKVMDEVTSKTFFFCNKCNTDSITNPDNFQEKIVSTDIFKILGLDLQLVSSRHLFRMPYSLHEKTSLVSIPLDKNKIKDFQLKDADPFNIKVSPILINPKKDEAKELLIQAIDWHKSQTKEEKLFSDKENESDSLDQNKNNKNKKFEQIKLTSSELKEEYFPPAINKILAGMEDGKKRSLFILLNFFKSLGLTMEEIEKRINDWNQLNKPPLKQGYINAQLVWHSKQKTILPPNFDNDIYKDLGVFDSDDLSAKVKNPVAYVIRKSGAWKKLPQNSESKVEKPQSQKIKRKRKKKDELYEIEVR